MIVWLEKGSIMSDLLGQELEWVEKYITYMVCVCVCVCLMGISPLVFLNRRHKGQRLSPESLRGRRREEPSTYTWNNSPHTIRAPAGHTQDTSETKASSTNLCTLLGVCHPLQDIFIVRPQLFYMLHTIYSNSKVCQTWFIILSLKII